MKLLWLPPFLELKVGTAEPLYAVLSSTSSDNSTSDPQDRRQLCIWVGHTGSKLNKVGFQIAVYEKVIKRKVLDQPREDILDGKR